MTRKYSKKTEEQRKKDVKRVREYRMKKKLEDTRIRNEVVKLKREIEKEKEEKYALNESLKILMQEHKILRDITTALNITNYHLIKEINELKVMNMRLEYKI